MRAQSLGGTFQPSVNFKARSRHIAGRRMADDQKEGLTKSIVDMLKAGNVLPSTLDFARANKLDHLLVVGVVKSLDVKFIAKITQKDRTEVTLTELGQKTVKSGSPEARLWEALGDKKATQAECAALIGEDADTGKTAVANGMKGGWFSIEKGETQLILRKATSIKDTVKEQVEGVVAGTVSDKKVMDLLKKRGFVDVKLTKEYTVEAGPKLNEFDKVYTMDLTAEMLSSGDWKKAEFKPLNLKSLGIRPRGGALHPLLKIRQEFRQIFLEMGFEEMPTDKYVESSFWNFDTLYQPQFHPTRDAHDTFFVKNPAESLQLPEEYLKEVQQVHQNGGNTGSIGYRYDWQRCEAEKNILRTHTTAVSSRMLYQLAEEYKRTGVFTPKKYFSIDRVFRNEATDATHLAEFHQVEGLVADVGLTLQDLIGSLTTYFDKQGLSDLKLKPAFNPYTEPSMEIFGYHPGLGKLVELGNSGMFRPEMLRAMGLPPNVNVIAWGVSLERPAMIKYAIQDIRTLIGHQVPYDFIIDNPVCRLDK